MYTEPKELYVYESLLELIDDLEAIPANKWCKLQTENKKGQSCAIGHINKKILGQHYGFRAVDKQLKSLGADMEALVEANNKADNPKEGAISYLKDILIEQTS